MSDCSTNAFLVPDGCGWWKDQNKKRRKVAYSNKIEPPKTGFETEYDIQPVCESCEHNLGYLMQAKVSADVSASYVELEQRYQQMERVVVDMLLSFHQANGISWLDDENYKRVVSTLISQCADDYIGELRELGVFPTSNEAMGGEH